MHDRPKSTVCGVGGAIRLVDPAVDRPLAAQPGVPPVMSQEVVPLEFQVTVNEVFSATDGGTLRVALGVEQLTPDWLLTVTLPV